MNDSIHKLDALQSRVETGIKCPRNPKEHGRLGVRIDGMLSCGMRGCVEGVPAPPLTADGTDYRLD